MLIFLPTKFASYYSIKNWFQTNSFINYQTIEKDWLLVEESAELLSQSLVDLWMSTSPAQLWWILIFLFNYILFTLNRWYLYILNDGRQFSPLSFLALFPGAVFCIFLPFFCNFAVHQQHEKASGQRHQGTHGHIGQHESAQFEQGTANDGTRNVPDTSEGLQKSLKTGE